MPDRSPTLGNSILQMAMQNRQMNLQANQSFQQAAQQDAQLRASLLNMVMGDNFARDQMAQQESQFGREMNFRKGVHADEYGLARDNFDQGIIEFDKMAGFEDRRVTEGETSGRHTRGRLDRLDARDVTVQNYGEFQNFMNRIGELRSQEKQDTERYGQSNLVWGTNLQVPDYSNAIRGIYDEAVVSGLGFTEAQLAELADAAGVGGGQGTSLLEEATGAGGVGGGQITAGASAGAQTGGGQGGGSIPLASAKNQPGQPARSIYEMMSVDGGLMGRLKKPLDGEMQGLPRHHWIRDLGRDIGRTVAPEIFGTDADQLNKVKNDVLNKPGFTKSMEDRKEIREGYDIIMEQGPPWWHFESGETDQVYNEEHAAEFALYEELVTRKALEDIMDQKGLTWETIEFKHMQEANNIGRVKERRALWNAEKEIDFMRESMTKIQAMTDPDDIVRALDDAGASMAVKLEQIEKSFNNGEYKFLTEAENVSFIRKLDTMKRTVGVLSDPNATEQARLQAMQEAEEGGAWDTFMGNLFDPTRSGPGGRALNSMF